jgi:hypothetical protein
MGGARWTKRNHSASVKVLYRVFILLNSSFSAQLHFRRAPSLVLKVLPSCGYLSLQVICRKRSIQTASSLHDTRGDSHRQTSRKKPLHMAVSTPSHLFDQRFRSRNMESRPHFHILWTVVARHAFPVKNSEGHDSTGKACAPLSVLEEETGRTTYHGSSHCNIVSLEVCLVGHLWDQAFLATEMLFVLSKFSYVFRFSIALAMSLTMVTITAKPSMILMTEAMTVALFLCSPVRSSAVETQRGLRIINFDTRDD